jgi:hypothetical protein
MGAGAVARTARRLGNHPRLRLSPLLTSWPARALTPAFAGVNRTFTGSQAALKKAKPKACIRAEQDSPKDNRNCRCDCSAGLIVE